MSVLSRLSHRLKSSPMLTASIQAGSLMCVGDLISQKIIEKKDNFDIMRNARFGAMGVLMVGPVLRTWYGILETRIVLSSPAKTAATKMAVDQILMAPAFLASFISINSILQGRSLENVKSDVSSNYVDVLISNYQLWPAVQMINFSVVPLQYRVLFVQTVAILWNSYLSWKTNA